MPPLIQHQGRRNHYNGKQRGQRRGKPPGVSNKKRASLLTAPSKSAVDESQDVARGFFRKLFVVRYDDLRHAFAVKFAHHVEYLIDELGIQLRGGLVIKHNLRLHRKTPSNRD